MPREQTVEVCGQFVGLREFNWSFWRLTVFEARILSHHLVDEIAVARSDLRQLVNLPLGVHGPPVSLDNISKKNEFDDPLSKYANVAAYGFG